MKVLEAIEWSDVWWDHPSEGGTRVLLIGDSITRGYRSFVKENVGENVFIDSYATSRALDNDCYFKEIKYILTANDCKYDVIHINNGLHGFHLNINSYYNGYLKLVNEIANYSPNSRIILAYSTPYMIKNDISIEHELNDTIIDRNEAVRKISEIKKLAINNLYEKAFGNIDIRAQDGVHYNESGYSFLGKLVANKISNYEG